PELPGEDQALDRAGQGLTVAELLVWDRARQSWDRVLVVWDEEPVSRAEPEEDPEGEWTPAQDSGNSPFEPGSLDEDLWFWDQLFQRRDLAPAGGKPRSQSGPL